MAYYYPDPSHTFSEYLLVPGYTSEECVPDHVSLKTPLVKYRKGQEDCPISLNIPMVSPSRLPRRAGFRSSSARSPSKARRRWCAA